MRSLGDYELITRLGSGTTAEVFLGRPRGLAAPEPGTSRPDGGLLAIKTIRAELTSTPGYLAAIGRERAAALAFRHPNAVRMDALDVLDGGAVLFAMEPVFGQTFAQVLHLATLTRTRVVPELWLHVGREVARALEKADGFGGLPLRHGAISPHSILIDYEGGVHLLGVGIGRSRGLLPTALHTLSYRAPEVFEGASFDGPTDVYSLGVTLYDAISGGRAYRRRSASETRVAVLDPASPPRLREAHELSPDVVSLIGAMMSRKRSERPDGWRLVGARLDEEIRTDAVELRAILSSFMSLWFEDDRRASRRLVEASLRTRAASTPPLRASSRPGVDPQPHAMRSVPSFEPDEGAETASLPDAPAELLTPEIAEPDVAPPSAAWTLLAPMPAPSAARRAMSAEEIQALALDLLERLSSPPESHEPPTAGRSTSAADAPGDHS